MRNTGRGARVVEHYRAVTKPKRPEERKKPGSNPLYGEEAGAMKNHTARFTDEQWKYIQEKGGGDFLRRLVDEHRGVVPLMNEGGTGQ